MSEIIYIVIYLLVSTILAFFLGRYIYKVFVGERNILTKVLEPIEKCIYKVLKIDKKDDMTVSQYIIAIFSLMIVSFIVLFSMIILQQFFLEDLERLTISNAFHIAVSFITNTNLQNYVPEIHISDLVQVLGISIQQFLSASMGIAVLFVLIRGLISKGKNILGNFYKDITRIILYILLPLCLIVGILLSANGVMQGISENKKGVTLSPIASSVAIKQLGTNGGGMTSLNSTGVIENPNERTNYIEMVSMLLIPMALVFMFGHAIKNQKQSLLIFIVMLTLIAVAIFTIFYVEMQSLELEVKDIANISIWSAVTTGTSNGSINYDISKLSPISTFVMLMLMGIGEVAFGGVGSGLYTMILFVILTVFIAGLMIGKTPEYLHKKIDVYDMKMVLIAIIGVPFTILIFSSIYYIYELISNTNVTNFVQILYYFFSAGANNGSSLGTINNTVANVLTALTMLIGRVLPIYAVLKLADNFSQKKYVAENVGTLSTSTVVFGVMLIVIVVVIGGLSFLPALVLGPLAS